jgi:hypothetical protein
MPHKAAPKKSEAKRMEDKVPALLKQLINLNKSQTVKDTPDVPDIIWPIVKRNKIFTFVRKVDLGIISPSVTVETDGAYSFTLNALPDYTEFTALFDNYRIIGVKINFMPLFTDTSATVAYPPIRTAIDYDDSAATTLAQLEEYDSCLASYTGQFFQRTLVPRLAVAAYAAGVFTSFAQRTYQWIDCASPGVILYGLKYAIPVAGAANQVWSVNADYMLQFKQSR